MSTLKEILIVDLEATCWDDKRFFVQEIIEFGFCLYSLKDKKILDATNIFVKPQFEISEFCTSLTGIDTTRVSQASRFLEVINTVKNYCLRYNVKAWGSWGAFDHDLIKEQCRREIAQYPLPKQHLNIKLMWSVLNGGRSLGVQKALSSKGLSFKGLPHRGMDDAINISRLLEEML